MSARTPGAGPVRRRHRLVAVLALLVVACGVTLLALRPWGEADGRPAGASAAAPRTAPAPTVSADQVPSDPELPAAPPSQVPSVVLADVPGLPAPLPPVGLGGTTDLSSRVSVRLTAVTAVTATAHEAGEISGPALAVTVEVTNATSAPISLDTVAVNAFSGPAATPAPVMRDGATQPLHGSLAAGHSETATYVFSVPVAQRGDVTVTVTYGAGPGSVAAVFSGAVA